MEGLRYYNFETYTYDPTQYIHINSFEHLHTHINKLMNNHHMDVKRVDEKLKVMKPSMFSFLFKKNEIQYGFESSYQNALSFKQFIQQTMNIFKDDVEEYIHFCIINVYILSCLGSSGHNTDKTLHQDAINYFLSTTGVLFTGFREILHDGFTFERIYYPNMLDLPRDVEHMLHTFKNDSIQYMIEIHRIVDEITDTDGEILTITNVTSIQEFLNDCIVYGVKTHLNELHSIKDVYYHKPIECIQNYILNMYIKYGNYEMNRIVNKKHAIELLENNKNRVNNSHYASEEYKTLIDNQLQVVKKRTEEFVLCSPELFVIDMLSKENMIKQLETMLMDIVNMVLDIMVISIDYRVVNRVQYAQQKYLKLKF